MEILACTNSTAASQPALDYGVWLAGKLDMPIVLLGIVEKPECYGEIEDLIETTCQEVNQEGLSCRSLIMEGPAEHAIRLAASEGAYLTLTGPLGRSSWRRLLRGRSFRLLMKAIRSPLVYVPSSRHRLKQILLCVGGLHHAEGILHIIGQLARRGDAEVTLLHITEPSILIYPALTNLNVDQNHVLNLARPIAKNIEQAIKRLTDLGVKVKMIHRHGYIVHEILAELQNGDYDMVGLGSRYSVQTLRHMYTPNVSAEVLEAVDLPVVVARSDQEDL